MTFNINDFFDIETEQDIPKKEPLVGGATVQERLKNYDRQKFNTKIEPYWSSVTNWSDIYGIDRNFLAGSLAAESSLTENVESSARAAGIAQIIPSTAREKAAELGDDDVASLNDDEIKQYLKNNPDKSIQYSAFYKKQLLDMFDGDEEKAIAAYNAGPSAVSKAVLKYNDDWYNHLPEETRNHIPTVMGFKSRFAQDRETQDDELLSFFDLTGTGQQVEQPTEELPVTPTEPTNRNVIQKSYDAADISAANLVSGVMKTPVLAANTIISLGNNFNKILNKIPGVNLPTDTELTGDEALFTPTNFVAKWADDVAATKDVLNKEFENKSFFDLLAEGNIGKAAEYMYYSSLQQGIQLALIGVTGGTAGLSTLAASSAGQKYEDIRKEGKVSNDVAITNALATGTLEAVFERLGSLGIVNDFKKVFSGVAKEIGEDAAKKVTKNAIKETFKGFFKGLAEEGSEEVGTSIAQDLTDKVSGVNPDLTMTDVIKNATNTLSGLGGSAVLGGATGGLRANKTNKLIKEQQKIDNKPQVTADIDKPSAIKFAYDSYDNFLETIKAEADAKGTDFKTTLEDAMAEDVLETTDDEKIAIRKLAIEKGFNKPTETKAEQKAIEDKTTKPKLLPAPEQTKQVPDDAKIEEAARIANIDPQILRQAAYNQAGTQQKPSGVKPAVTAPKATLNGYTEEGAKKRGEILASNLSDVEFIGVQEGIESAKRSIPATLMFNLKAKGKETSITVPIGSSINDLQQVVKAKLEEYETGKKQTKKTKITTKQEPQAKDVVKITVNGKTKNVLRSELKQEPTAEEKETEAILKQQEETKGKLEKKIVRKAYTVKQPETTQESTIEPKVVESTPEQLSSIVEPPKAVKIEDIKVEQKQTTQKAPNYEFLVEKTASEQGYEVRIKKANDDNSEDMYVFDNKKTKQIKMVPVKRALKAAEAGTGALRSIIGETKKIVDVGEGVSGAIGKETERRPSQERKIEALEEARDTPVPYSPEKHDQLIGLGSVTSEAYRRLDVYTKDGKDKLDLRDPTSISKLQDFQDDYVVKITDYGERSLSNLKRKDAEIESSQEQNEEEQIDSKKQSKYDYSTNDPDNSNPYEQDMSDEYIDSDKISPEDRLLAKTDNTNTKDINNKLINTNTITKDNIINIINNNIINTKDNSIYKLVNTFNDLTDNQKNALGNNTDTQAFVDRQGTIWLIADKITSEDELLNKILPHEKLHKGLAIKLTKDFANDYNKELKDIWDILDDDTKAKVIDNSFTKENVKFDDTNPEHIYKATQEALATKAETPNKQNLLDKMVGYIRDWLRKIGFINRWTDNDIQSLIKVSLKLANKVSEAKVTKPLAKALTEEENLKRRDKAERKTNQLADLWKIKKNIKDFRATQLNLRRYANTWFKAKDQNRELLNIITSIKTPEDVASVFNRIKELSVNTDRGKAVKNYHDTVIKIKRSRNEQTNERENRDEFAQVKKEIQEELDKVIAKADEDLRDISVYDALNRLNTNVRSKIPTAKKQVIDKKSGEVIREIGDKIVSKPIKRAIAMGLVEMDGDFVKLSETGSNWLKDKTDDSDFKNNVLSGNSLEEANEFIKDKLNENKNFKKEIADEKNSTNRQAVVSLADQLEKHFKKTPKQIKKLNGIKTAIEKRRPSLEDTLTLKEGSINAEFLSLELDDDKENGAFTSNMFQPAWDEYDYKETVERELIHNTALKADELRAKGYDVDKYLAVSGKTGHGKTKQTTVKLGDETVTMDAGRKITLYMLSLDNDGLRHLLNGGFKVPINTKNDILIDKTFKVTEEDLSDLYDGMTEEELAIADMVRGYFDSLATYINKTSNETLGYDLANVVNFFPIKVDSLSHGDKGKTITDDMKSMDDVVRNIKQSFAAHRLKARVEGANQPVTLEDFTQAMGRTHNLAMAYIGSANTIERLQKLMHSDYKFKIYDSALHDEMIDNGELEKHEYNGVQYVNLTDKSEIKSISDVEGEPFNLKMNQMFASKGRPTDYKIYEHWLNSMQRDLYIPTDLGIDKLSNKLLSGMAIGFLSKPNVAVKQLVGAVNMLSNIVLDSNVRDKYAIKELFTSMIDSVKGKKGINEIEIKKHSAFLANRLDNADRLLYEGLSDSLGRQLVGNKTKGVRKIISSRVLLAPLVWFDGITTKYAWAVAKKVAEANGFEKGSDAYWKEVKTTAEAYVRRTQPTTATIDRNAFLNSKNAILKQVVFLKGQTFKNAMNVFRNYRILTNPESTGKNRLKAIAGIANILTVQSVALATMDTVYRGLRGAWEEPDKESLIFIKNIIRYSLGSVGIIGDIINEIVNLSYSESYEAKVGDTIYRDAVSNAFNLGKYIYKYSSEGYLSNNDIKKFKQALSKVGALTGKPVPFIIDAFDIAKNFINVADGGEFGRTY